MPNLLFVVLDGLWFGLEVEIPVLYDFDLAVCEPHVVAGRELIDVAKHRVRSGYKLEADIMVERLRINLPLNLWHLQNGFDLGGEDQLVAMPVVVQRLDAESVADEDQFALLAIPDGEGEHAVEQLDAIRPIFFVSMYDDFRVGSALEGMAFGQQRVANLLEVVDLAVVGYPDRAVFVGHGLPTVLTEINDAEPPMAQGHVIIQVSPILVRSSVGEHTTHRGNQPLIFPGKSSDSAHV